MDEHEHGPDELGAEGEPKAGPGPVDPLVEGAPGRRRASARASVPDDGAESPFDEGDAGLPFDSESSPHAWVGAVTAAGLGLMAVELFVLLGTVAQGLAVERLQGDFLHKLGVAFLSNVGSANGLTILAAAVLVALPVLVGAPLTATQNSRRATALALGSILALVVILATPMAVRARLHVLDIGNQPVDSLARRVLGTYTIGTLGTAAVALGTCLGLARAGARRSSAADDGDMGTVGTGIGETVAPHP